MPNVAFNQVPARPGPADALQKIADLYTKYALELKPQYRLKELSEQSTMARIAEQLRHNQVMEDVGRGRNESLDRYRGELTDWRNRQANEPKIVNVPGVGPVAIRPRPAGGGAAPPSGLPPAPAGIPPQTDGPMSVMPGPTAPPAMPPQAPGGANPFAAGDYEITPLSMPPVNAAPPQPKYVTVTGVGLVEIAPGKPPRVVIPAVPRPSGGGAPPAPPRTAQGERSLVPGSKDAYSFVGKNYRPNARDSQTGGREKYTRAQAVGATENIRALGFEPKWLSTKDGQTWHLDAIVPNGGASPPTTRTGEAIRSQAKTPAQTKKVINGRTYIKVNGQWFEK